jgi:hypothetical protein
MFEKLRVLGRRVRVFSRAGLLGVGWGCWQTYINNARCGRQVVVLTIGHIGRDFGQEIVYFGGSRVCLTHLGCFGTPRRAGGGRAVSMR